LYWFEGYDELATIGVIGNDWVKFQPDVRWPSMTKHTFSNTVAFLGALQFGKIAGSQFTRVQSLETLYPLHGDEGVVPM